MNNLLQLATHFSSEVFIKSGGFSKFNNKLGAKNPIALKVSGISALIAMGIAIWPFRANFWRTEALHDVTEEGKLCICVQVSRAHLPSPVLYSIMGGCADFILCRSLKYFHWAQKVGWSTWGFISLIADLGHVLHCNAAHEMWVLHQNYPSGPTGNLPWQSSWWSLERAAAPFSLPGPNSVADLYQQGLSQHFGLALSGQAGPELKCKREFRKLCLASLHV